MSVLINGSSRRCTTNSAYRRPSAAAPCGLRTTGGLRVRSPIADPVSAQPDLYDAPTREAPSLQGRRCGGCGHVFFPPQDYGCESCGAGPEHLEPATLPATGVLGAAVPVHFDPGGRAPFIAIEVLLDAGPTIGAMLSEPSDAGPPPGTRVHGVLVPQGGEGHDKVELRFEADPGQSPEI